MRAALGAVAAMLASPAFAACGSAAEPTGEPRGNYTLARAQAFDDFPLYYAGERIDGLPLVAVVRRNDTANYVSFVYGDCVSAEYDQGCAPPVEIQVWPGCRRHLGLYDSSVTGTPKPEPAEIRGVPAAFFDDGTRLELHTRGSAVVVFAETRERALFVAQALRLVNGPGPRGDLPPPTRDDVDGRSGC